MKLWDYLKGKMLQYGDKIAFAQLGITYAELCALGEDFSRTGTLELCEGKTREKQAYQIIKCLAKGKVAVPVSEDYGKERAEIIRQQMCGDNTRYPDVAFVMFTSGSTGSPKGVMLTDENVICNLEYIASYFDVSDMSRICIARPLVHIAVITGELLYALCNGLTIYFYEENFIPKRLIAYFKQNSIDVFCTTPTMFLSLAHCVEKEAYFQYENALKERMGEWTPLRYRVFLEGAKITACPLKICVTSGEILTADTAKILSNAFPGSQFYNVYGLTEHSPRICALTPEDFTRKAGSVGKAIGNVKLKIVDGELYVKSPCVMKGYYNNKAATCEKIKDGWLNTGDLAHCDEDGYFYIDGRKDDMIIRAGVNIFPSEIEEKVILCEGVEDCTVFGERDTGYGQKIILRYVGVCDRTNLRRFLENHLPPYLVPDRIEKTETLNTTASGKKLRR